MVPKVPASRSVMTRIGAPNDLSHRRSATAGGLGEASAAAARHERSSRLFLPEPLNCERPTPFRREEQKDKAVQDRQLTAID
jgi:hypothetical protein